ncbi:uncharacterized protein Z520_10800 [Fonsecaea multimorphosa CBS 102226]|uniref:Uncharacterized protein n=1 Tax=Fonsecaea multimorphosa CBS 102226 TaxID=1442371 RepID=A0A0D2I870_9EURO|nr:uncharacterized protein Z520_10800 [Fonsecaea multimorphosa CBS 102226]KIX93381.1 hypothetical protein Z520_10800 [Fonsecaea multimorphosa CBS 102226]OAL18681.1 hypothetical protein AYO22_10374 [Fonsecaea multimorphosa]
MSSNRKSDRSSASNSGGNSGSSSRRDRQLHLDSSKDERNPAPLHSSSTPSTRVSTGTVPSSETRVKESDVSIPISQEAQGQNQRQRSPSIDESSSHDPALPTPSLTEGGTCIEDGHRTDEGSHTSEPPPQAGESESPPHYNEAPSLGSSMLLGVGSGIGSGMYSQIPQPYGPLDYLDEEDNRPNHHRRQLNNIHGHDCGQRH